MDDDGGNQQQEDDNDNNNYYYDGDDNMNGDDNNINAGAVNEWETTTTVDPGPWLLIGTTIFCLVVMFIIVPLAVWFRLHRRRTRKVVEDSKRQQLLLEVDDAEMKAAVEETASCKQASNEHPPTPSRLTLLSSIVAWDAETRKILRLALPYTLSGFASSLLHNVGLILMSQALGVKAVAAVCLVQLVGDLVDGVFMSGLYACTSLCAHAVGAGQATLAGQYVQMAVMLHFLASLGMWYIWYHHMYDLILVWLNWGDDTTATLCQTFVRTYFLRYILHGMSSGLWQLLEVANHTVASAIFGIAEGVTGVVGVGIFVYTCDISHAETALRTIAWIYNATALLYLLLGFLWATCRGWLKPFAPGLFGTCTLCGGSNSITHLLKTLWKQALPLAVGSLLNNAEWTVLTMFASSLGPAEVTTWALLGNVWDCMSATTSGLADAAELRVAHHLGENQARSAQLSAYKSLGLVMMVAILISTLCLCFPSFLANWYTSDDETIQELLLELIPFISVANVTMAFGMHCWSLIGAQGKYKLATRITFISSWCISVPLATVYVFLLKFNLQGLTSAVVLGYVTTAASLSYILLSTKWKKVATKIHNEYEKDDETDSESDDSEDSDNDNDGSRNDADDFFAALRQNKSKVALAKARNFVRLLHMPPYRKSGIVLANMKYYKNVDNTFVMKVRSWSPLRNQIHEGDSILAVDGLDVRKESAQTIVNRLVQARRRGCEIAVTRGDAASFFLKNNKVWNNNALIGVESMAEDEQEPPPKPLRWKLSRTLSHLVSKKKKKKREAGDCSINNNSDGGPKVMIMVQKSDHPLAHWSREEA
eukprot:CAMPEP_0194259290 /NCGR_PEP_ID=MMETSP0158-20130606/43284_1 /TAXON_ID=33649 /ORGANISM="Thalassionema nitzschioides, Strain L26-B" /LENGTH=822 /DNA_ID=CAMNT_0038999045 /DNA_START=125 /DNA_END=2593 /DNA_ORIENTATION=+